MHCRYKLTRFKRGPTAERCCTIGCDCHLRGQAPCCRRLVAPDKEPSICCRVVRHCLSLVGSPVATGGRTNSSRAAPQLCCLDNQKVVHIETSPQQVYPLAACLPANAAFTTHVRLCLALHLHTSRSMHKLFTSVCRWRCTLPGSCCGSGRPGSGRNSWPPGRTPSQR